MSLFSDSSTPADSESAVTSRTSASYRNPPLTRGLKRPRMNEKMIKHLVARRYGALDDFSQIIAGWGEISKQTGVNKDTIRKAVTRFHKNGDRWLPVNAAYNNVGAPRLLSASIEAEITSWQTLNDMRFLPMRRRLELIRREHGIAVSLNTLRRVYKRRGVRFLQAKAVKRHT